MMMMMMITIAKIEKSEMFSVIDELMEAGGVCVAIDAPYLDSLMADASDAFISFDFAIVFVVGYIFHLEIVSIKLNCAWWQWKEWHPSGCNHISNIVLKSNGCNQCEQVPVSVVSITDQSLIVVWYSLI